MTTNRHNADTTAEENWERYQYGLYRGHTRYTARAAECENFYLGGGRQWEESDRAALEEEGRPALEANEILPALNSAIGYQIHNRMDIAFRPRSGGATQGLADLRSKLAMQIADNNKLHWTETQVFSDGMIEQRGYFDIRISFDDNIQGELRITELDPRDVLPDPDAKTYDPSGWGDVTVTRWYTLNEIAAMFGQEKADAVAAMHGDEGEQDFGDADEAAEEGERNKFGDTNSGNGNTYYAWMRRDKGTVRYRVLDRQVREFKLKDVLVTPLGDIRSLDSMPDDVRAKEEAAGAAVVRRMAHSIRWTVSTRYVTLMDGDSPYDRFTVVPFFPYFRRGKTIGMVDNAIDPQRILNKTMSQFVHIVNSAANSGWKVEENSLSNMTSEDLEDAGAKNGLVIEYRKNSTSPEKIQPSQMPAGMDRLLERALFTLKEVTVPDAMRGTQGAEISGVAIQSRQSASQQQLAVPLDALARTRNLVARWIDYAIKYFYDAPRVLRIAKNDPDTGEETTEAVDLNAFDGEGGYINDVTAGEYDVVVSEQPMQVTFENSQFTQAIEMRKQGVAIPDPVVVQHSNLSRKADIIEQMRGAGGPTEEQAALVAAQAAKVEAETERIKAETVNKLVESTFSAIQTARVITETPQTAGTADSLLKSAGFVDKDAAPIVPEASAPPSGNPPPVNTNPLTPTNPAVGMNSGMESGDASLPSAP